MTRAERRRLLESAARKREVGESLTQDEVAARLRLSRARVSQIEAQAIRKLQALLADSPWAPSFG